MESLLFIAGSVAGLVLLAVPGGLAAACVHGGIARRESGTTVTGVGLALVALAWGCGVVPTLALYACLATGIRIGWGTLILASLLSSVVSVLVWRRRGVDLDAVRASLRAAAPVFAAAAAVGLLWFLTCDERSGVSESCMFRTAYAAAGHVAPMSEVPPDIDLLRDNVQDARLGNVGVLAAFAVLFQGLGFRLLFGLCGAMLALGGHAIGAWTGGGRAWGWVGLAVLALNPYALSLPMVDENLLTLAFGCSVVPFAAARGRGWAVAGVLFGLVVAMRHVMLPALPAMLLAARYSRAGWRGVGALTAAFGVTSIPIALHHHLALGSVLRFESNELFLPFPYRFLDHDFMFEGLLNWPFHDHVVRTPYNPLPMFAWWPLHLADHLGTVLAAAALAGVVALWWRSRRTAAFWILWAPVVMTGLAFQEGWDIVNKMWVMLIVFAAVAAWSVGGLAWAGRRPRVGVPVIVALAIGLQVGARQLTDWRVPQDERYICIEPGVTPEWPHAVRGAREEATALAPWPDLGGLSHNGPFLAPAKLAAVFRTLASPGLPLEPRPWGWLPGEPPPQGPPVTLEIDLNADPLGGGTLVRHTRQAPHLDLTEPDVVQVLDRVLTAWEPCPFQVYAGRSDDVSAVVLYRDCPRVEASCEEWKEPRDERLAVQRCWALFTLLGEEERCGDLEVVGSAALVVRVRVPSGGLSVALEQNIGADRVHLWTGTVGPDEIELAGPVIPWKN